jgi:hypothetical protein
MQGIWVFASNAARDAAVTAPAEGNFAFTKDTNSLWYYDGAAWVASGATGDIEGVTAGVGISGGGTSGTVTVTNSMATEFDAKGDLVVGTGADTFDKLTVGANDTVLTADSSTATGLKWAAPAAGASFKGCTAYKNGSNQSVSSETATVITYDAEEFDTDSFHSTSTNTSRFTIPAGLAGKYQIAVVAQISSNSTGYRQFNILKNGTAVSRNVAAAVNGLNTVANVVAVLDLAVADYVELMVYQNGGSLNADAGQTQQRFSLIYLGA